MLAHLGVCAVGRERLAETSHELPAPTGLQTFLHAANTSRTPASSSKRRPDVLAHAGVRVGARRGATRYQFELSTRDRLRRRQRAGLVAPKLTSPAASVPLALPWITGEPASLYWRVRAVGQRQPVAAGARRRRSTCAGPTENRDSAATRSASRPGTPAPSAGHRRGRDRLPGLVPGASAQQDVRDDHERRRRARVYAQRRPLGRRPLARPRRARRLRQDVERLPRVSYGPWSPVYQRRRLTPGRHRSRSPLNTISSERCSRTSARPPVDQGRLRSRQPRARRHARRSLLADARRPLPRLRLHRPGLREPRLHQLPGRARLRAAVDGG